jgi:hypothetical protein
VSTFRVFQRFKNFLVSVFRDDDFGRGFSTFWAHEVAYLVEALGFKSEDRGLDSR